MVQGNEDRVWEACGQEEDEGREEKQIVTLSPY